MMVTVKLNSWLTVIVTLFHGLFPRERFLFLSSYFCFMFHLFEKRQLSNSTSVKRL